MRPSDTPRPRARGGAFRSERGFTLVELMVVVLVLGVVLAIGVPTFLGMRARAQDRAAESGLRTALTAANALLVAAGTPTAGGLTAEEPSITYVDSPAASSGPRVVSVAWNSPVWAAAVRSDTGTCFFVTVVASQPRHASGTGTCTAAQALTAAGAPRYWVGNGASTWTAASSWSFSSGGAGGAGAPGPNDDVVFDERSGSATVSAAEDVAVRSWTQTSGYTGTVTFASLFAGPFRTVTVSGDATLSSGTWTHTANATVASYRLDVAIGGNLTVGAAAAIDVSGRGFSAYGGSGYGFYGSSHGGTGGSGVAPYGSATAPVTLGSGATGYAGGGAVRLTVSGAFTLDGQVNADGLGAWNAGAASAGGSVWITAATLSGSGAISANGGVDAWRGHGGGGRVAVYLTGVGATFPATPSVSAFGAGGNSNGYNASAGTVYLQTAADAAGAGMWVFDNNGACIAGRGTRPPASTTWVITKTTLRRCGLVAAETGSTVDLSGATITGATGVSGHGVRFGGGSLSLPPDVQINDWSLVIDTPWTYAGNMTVGSGGRITHSANGQTALYAVDLTVTGSLTVNAGAAIDVSGRGFSAYGGPGYGFYGSSHGGTGGSGAPTYGSATAPVTLGSGATGYAGGGAVKLTVSGAFTLNGPVNANGLGAWNAGAASAGGSVWITAATLSGSGAISANGGVDAWRGHGGGGRVAITLTQPGATLGATPTRTANGATGNSNGYNAQPGTVNVTLTP